jgi:uncharacterized cupredoxin-like copper-binding protein
VRYQAAARAKAQLASKVSMLALAAGMIALAGCGSSSSTTSSSASTPPTSSSAASSTPAAATGGEGQSLSLAANAEGELKFNTTSLTAKAGKVSIAFTNSAALSHNVTVASSSGAVLGATPTFQGGSKTLSLNLTPGTYKFYCSVPGHRQAGMEGTLTVR